MSEAGWCCKCLGTELTGDYGQVQATKFCSAAYSCNFHRHKWWLCKIHLSNQQTSLGLYPWGVIRIVIEMCVYCWFRLAACSLLFTLFNDSEASTCTPEMNLHWVALALSWAWAFSPSGYPHPVADSTVIPCKSEHWLYMWLCAEGCLVYLLFVKCLATQFRTTIEANHCRQLSILALCVSTHTMSQPAIKHKCLSCKWCAQRAQQPQYKPCSLQRDMCKVEASATAYMQLSHTRREKRERVTQQKTKSQQAIWNEIGHNVRKTHGHCLVQSCTSPISRPLRQKASLNSRWEQQYTWGRPAVASNR